MIKGGVQHYFSKKATVVVSLSSHLFGPENNCSLPQMSGNPSFYSAPARLENKEKKAYTQTSI